MGTGSLGARHPLLRDTLLWSIPALLFGATLRAMLLSYSPYAFWGSDSMSYFGFTYELFTRHVLTLNEKRRYLYPLLMLPTSLLPGSPLRWTAWLQHTMGLLAVLPIGYTVRRIFQHWRWTIVPVTVFYAGLPIFIWYEHELIGESLFFAGCAWTIGGWMAWVAAEKPERARRLWWWLVAPLAVVILTKPSGRFLWPGLLLGLALVWQWRRLDWKQATSLAVLFVISLTVGQKTQGDRLLYTTAFPLTRLDTPLHADYKAQIRDLVEPLRKNIDVYYTLENEAFLRAPENETQRPLWAALGKNRFPLYHELAMEGIKARPDLFLYIALQRAVASMNEGHGKESHYSPTSYASRFEPLYLSAVEEKPALLRMLFALKKNEPIPPYDEFKKMVSPKPESPVALALEKYVIKFQAATRWVAQADGVVPINRKLTELHLTAAGWWLAAGALLSLLRPYRSSLMVWTFTGAGYVIGVFLVGSHNARYAAPVWPVLILLLALPVDVALAAACELLEKLRRPHARMETAS